MLSIFRAIQLKSPPIKPAARAASAAGSTGSGVSSFRVWSPGPFLYTWKLYTLRGVSPKTMITLSTAGST